MSEIEFAILSDDIVVIKVNERGSFKNGFLIKQFAEKIVKEGRNPKFIIDLEKCPAVDSAFMGVLAGLSRDQKSRGEGAISIVNVNEKVKLSMTTLGLHKIADLRDDSPITKIKSMQEMDSSDFELLSKKEQTLFMIKTHQELIDLDNGNLATFQDLMFYLKDSLEKENEDD